MVTNQEEKLVGNRRLGGSLGYSDHKMEDVRILRGTGKANSRITTLDFWKADWNPFRDLFGKIPWETALERRGVQESWLVFKDHLLHAKE